MLLSESLAELLKNKGFGPTFEILIWVQGSSGGGGEDSGILIQNHVGEPLLTLPMGKERPGQKAGFNSNHARDTGLP